MRLVESQVYKELVAHPHFNPRVVEAISNHANSRALNDEEFIAFIRQEFDDPSRVWERPFRVDLSPCGRELLVLLWTFAGAADLGDLRRVIATLNQRLGGGEALDQFHGAVRHLDGNFIRTNQFPSYPDKGVRVIVEFHNPSVEEFIETLIEKEPERLVSIIPGIETELQVQVIAEKLRELRLKEALDPKSLASIKNSRARVHAERLCKIG